MEFNSSLKNNAKISVFSNDDFTGNIKFYKKNNKIALQNLRFQLTTIIVMITPKLTKEEIIFRLEFLQ